MKTSFFDGGRRAYHHGRLKDALIEAARQLVAERGPEGFTLAEAAKRVGVTGAAPYRHFADRQALLAELAERGFVLFDDALRAAFDQGRPDAAAAFRRMGRAYLRFAREEPGLYSAMFSAGGPPTPAADGAFASLAAATRMVLLQYSVEMEDVSGLARQIWAVSHGAATLANAGHFTGAPGCDPAELMEAATSTLLEMAVRRALAR